VTRLGATTAVLIPLKAFASAKARLAPMVDGPDRSALAQRMAAGVVRAAVPLPTWVVCDDPEVAAWSLRHGAGVCWRRAPGLNPAVTAGVGFLAADGVDRVVVAHADLPRATAGSLVALTDHDPGAVVIVPDRHRDGSNVVVVPSDAGFRFAYGPGSFAAHRAEAARLGRPLVVVDDPDLAWDVDVPADLPALRSPARPEDR
jgi:2-phospho-L-lactate/phosphoenolpyruvate guanylyltransferase